ncbi:hypothetical protein I4U23_024560 [Adineta vaga]|nr:hypothetical protein I4U23_024560 [Adineta vaga]
MAAVLNPYNAFTGFQQQSFYSGFPLNFSTAPVANRFYAPPQFPIYSQPPPMTAYPSESARGYPQQQQQAPCQAQQVPCQARQTSYQAQGASRQPQQAPMHPQQAPLPLRQQNTIRSQNVPMPPPPPPQSVPSQERTVEYVDADPSIFRRRQPRIIRQVIKLPTPEPIYRQVRHRLPTPEREVIQRTIIKKANGDVVVRQQQPSRPRTESRTENTSSRHSTRHRHVYTD